MNGTHGATSQALHDLARTLLLQHSIVADTPALIAALQTDPWLLRATQMQERISIAIVQRTAAGLPWPYPTLESFNAENEPVNILIPMRLIEPTSTKLDAAASDREKLTWLIDDLLAQVTRTHLNRSAANSYTARARTENNIQAEVWRVANAVDVPRSPSSDSNTLVLDYATALAKTIAGPAMVIAAQHATMTLAQTLDQHNEMEPILSDILSSYAKSKPW
jgi:hypothetical protein